MILNRFALLALTIGLGPLFKLGGTVYISSVSHEGASPFALIWLLDAFGALFLAFGFFSSDLYLTRNIKEKNAQTQKNIYWMIFFINIFTSIPLIYCLYFFSPDLVGRLFNIADIQHRILTIALIATVSLNLFRILFSSLRIIEERSKLLLFSLSYYSIQFFGLLFLSKILDDLVLAYYFSYIPTFIILFVFSFWSFGFPNLNASLQAENIKDYFLFARINFFVEPVSLMLGFIERKLIASSFEIGLVNVYAQAIKFIEPISLAGKVVKFSLIGSIVDYVSERDSDVHKYKLINMRKYLTGSLLSIAVFYPCIHFIFDFIGVKIPTYELLLWLSSVSIVGMLTFYHSMAFFYNANFSFTSIIDILSLCIAWAFWMLPLDKSILILAIGITLKVCCQFSLRLYYSSTQPGHLRSSLNEVAAIYSILFGSLLFLLYSY